MSSRTLAKFPDAVTAVSLGPGQVVDGTSGAVIEDDGEWASRPAPVSAIGFIDFAWYEEQRVRLAAHAAQVASVSESLAMAWYKVIRRSLQDLPIQQGGRNLMNPQYAANLKSLAMALGLAHRTLSSYRTAVSRTPDEARFRELIKGMSWSQFVFSMKSSPAYRVNAILAGEDAPPSDAYRGVTRDGIRIRCVIQVPTETTEFLMEHGLDRSDVTAVCVSHLRQPDVQRKLLKLFRLSAEEAS
jgi:hypothetical protein